MCGAQFEIVCQYSHSICEGASVQVASFQHLPGLDFVVFQVCYRELYSREVLVREFEDSVGENLQLLQ